MATVEEILRSYEDKVTDKPITISGDHNYIHSGKAFSLVGTATINDAATLKFNFKTPNPTDPNLKGGKYIHWRPAGVSTSAAGLQYSLYEASTSISGGSAVTPLNKNRNISKLSNMQAFTQGVTATEGTLIQTGSFGTAGNPARASGGASGADLEIVLKTNTDYTINLVNLGGANSIVTWDFFWYEEDGYDGR